MTPDAWAPDGVPPEDGRDGPARPGFRPRPAPLSEILGPREIADALWLASEYPELVTGRQYVEEDGTRFRALRDAGAPGRHGSIDQDQDPDTELPADGDGGPDRSRREPEATQLGAAGAAAPSGSEPETSLPGTEPASAEGLARGEIGEEAPPSNGGAERTVRRTALVPLTRASRSGFDHLAVERALRPLRGLRDSAHFRVLDEDATAEQIAMAPRLPPVLRPGPERRWEAVLVVDNAPHMAVWGTTAERFATVLRRHAGFRSVDLRTMDTSGTGVAEVTVRSAGRGARPQPPETLVDPTGRRIVFVLTDGVAPAWRSGAAQHALARWGAAQPITVLHALPQRLWHRSGLFPARLRLSATGPWVNNGRVTWQPAEPLAASLLPPGERQKLLPVPVLELREDWLAPWADVVAGEGPRWAVMAAVLIRQAGSPAGPEPRTPTPGGLPRVSSPADRVVRFRNWASRDAFTLATRLAAVELDLCTMSAVQRRTMPRSDPVHLAELLISELVQPAPGEADGHAFLFRDGVREELLAAGSRHGTERALVTAAEHLAPTSSAARELLVYFQQPGSSSQVIDVTPDNIRFRQAEHAALQALSGPHLRRARQISSGISDQTSEYHTVAGGAGSLGTSQADDSPSPDVIEAPPADSPDTGISWRNGTGVAPHHKNMTPSQSVTERRQERPGGTHVSTVPAAAERPATQHDAVGGPRPASPAVWGNMPPRNAVFTGREDLLVSLERGLRAGPTAVLPHALHGMGGVGKSQLALEYVYRHAADYDVVWWIPAERPTQIQQAFVELARRLRLPVTGEAITAVPAVLDALRTGNPYGNWLLVFDNAESPTSVMDYVPSTVGGGPVGSVIVTSRNPQWSTLAQPLEVDVFERQESVQLLQRRNPDLAAEDADMLADVLGDLPLAVEQASAWRAETGMPAAEYLRLFEEKRAELMSVSPPDQYEETVATAWNVSLDHVESKNVAALQLLQLCAYFAPEPISRQFFSSALVEPIAAELDRAFTDPLRLSRAIREISRYSLAKIDHRTNSVQMHRLVQAVLVARMTEEQRVRFRHGAQLLLAANTPNDPRAPQNWTRFGQLYPHVVVSQAAHSPHPTVRQMVFKVAEYLFYWGDHEAALEFAQSTYNTWRELYGDGDQQTQLLGRHLRFVLWRMGRYPQAAELGERMLTVLENLGSEAEEEYLRVKGQVSADRRVRGDFPGALAFDEEVYERAVRAYGEDDPETLAHAHNLAVCLRVNGEFRRAMDLDEATWRRKAEMFGTDSPASLSSETAVNLDRRELGEYNAVVQPSQEAVDKHFEVFGDLHPQTLLTLGQLGVARRRAGQHDAALEHTRKARTALIERYGERSPDTLQNSLNLSIDLRQTGALREALDLGERTRKLYGEILGAEHPYTASADVNHAVTLRLLDRTDAARNLNESALQRLRAQLSPHHPSILVCSINLSNDLFAQGDAVAALELDNETLHMAEEALGPRHPTTLVLRGNRACDLRALGRVEEAEASHAEALAGIGEVLGEEHPAFADTQAWRRANCDIDPMPF